MTKTVLGSAVQNGPVRMLGHYSWRQNKKIKCFVHSTFGPVSKQCRNQTIYKPIIHAAKTQNRAVLSCLAVEACNDTQSPLNKHNHKSVSFVIADCSRSFKMPYGFSPYSSTKLYPRP